MGSLCQELANYNSIHTYIDGQSDTELWFVVDMNMIKCPPFTRLAGNEEDVCGGDQEFMSGGVVLHLWICSGFGV